MASVQFFSSKITPPYCIALPHMLLHMPCVLGKASSYMQGRPGFRISLSGSCATSPIKTLPESPKAYSVSLRMLMMSCGCIFNHSLRLFENTDSCRLLVGFAEACLYRLYQRTSTGYAKQTNYDLWRLEKLYLLCEQHNAVHIILVL